MNIVYFIVTATTLLFDEWWWVAVFGTENQIDLDYPALSPSLGLYTRDDLPIWNLPSQYSPLYGINVVDD